jgi:hypothetical protein
MAQENHCRTSRGMNTVKQTVWTEPLHLFTYHCNQKYFCSLITGKNTTRHMACASDNSKTGLKLYYNMFSGKAEHVPEETVYPFKTEFY